MQNPVGEAFIERADPEEKPRAVYNEAEQDKGDGDAHRGGEEESKEGANQQHSDGGDDSRGGEPDQLAGERPEVVREELAVENPQHRSLVAAAAAGGGEEAAHIEIEREGAETQRNQDQGAEETDPTPECRKHTQSPTASLVRHEGVQAQAQH